MTYITPILTSTTYLDYFSGESMHVISNCSFFLTHATCQHVLAMYVVVEHMIYIPSL